MLSAQAIKEFKAIYLKKFGQELTDEEAEEKGLELLRFMRLIYRPIPKEDEAVVKELR